MFGLGMQELVIILIIVGILFGAKSLPGIGKGLGEAIRGFKKSVSDTEEQLIENQKPSEETTKEEK